LKVAQEVAESASKLAANGTAGESWASELEAKLQEGEAMISKLKVKVKELEIEKTAGIKEEDQTARDDEKRLDAMQLQDAGAEVTMLQSMLKTAEKTSAELEIQVL
jgi:hypothetical protein